MEATGKRYVQYPSRTSTFTLWGIGDIHYGATGCDIKNVKRDIEEIANDPCALWVGLGDYGDFITPRDKRWASGALIDEAKLNVGRLGKWVTESIRDLFYPIKDKCLGMLMGNHETKYFDQTDQEDLHSWLCTELESPNLRYCGFFDLVFVRVPGCLPARLQHAPKKLDSSSGTQQFRVYCHHGSGSAATPGGRLASLIKHMSMVEADIIMTGHVHDQKAQRLITLTADSSCTKIVERHQVGVICGSYLKTYTSGTTSYGEIRGYPPTSLGAARLQVIPDKREIRGEA